MVRAKHQHRDSLHTSCLMCLCVLLHIIASLSVYSSVSRCPTFSQKGDGIALAPCTASPADVMDVVLAILLCSKHFLAGSHVQRVDTRRYEAPCDSRSMEGKTNLEQACQILSACINMFTVQQRLPPEDHS